MDERMLSVKGLSGLLRAVAGRMEGNVDGLNKELLLQSAEQIDRLEIVAESAEVIVKLVPRVKSGRDRKFVLVRHILLSDLADALVAAGKTVNRENV